MLFHELFIFLNSSFELNRGEGEVSNLEERLEEALSKIDDFVRERTDLLEDLEATKHSLLQIQHKLKEVIFTTCITIIRSYEFLKN